MLTQFLLNGFIAGSFYSLIALGFSIIYQTTRFFPACVNNTTAGRHFAQGAVCIFHRAIDEVFRL
jgi:branched-subunit amino acid ABC-type transport system permease component